MPTPESLTVLCMCSFRVLISVLWERARYVRRYEQLYVNRCLGIFLLQADFLHACLDSWQNESGCTDHVGAVV